MLNLTINQYDAIVKSHDHSFEVLQKSQIGNFSVVTLQVATLKIPDLVFFAIHPKFLIGTFGIRVQYRKSKYFSEILLKTVYFFIRKVTG